MNTTPGEKTTHPDADVLSSSDKKPFLKPGPSSSQKIRGKVIQEIYRSPNGFSVLKLQSGSEMGTLAGPRIESESMVGLSATFNGKWDVHHKYGKQFKFNSYCMEDSGLFFFLARVVKVSGNRWRGKSPDSRGRRDCPDHRGASERLEEIKGSKERSGRKSSNPGRSIKPSSAFLPFGPVRHSDKHDYSHLQPFRGEFKAADQGESLLHDRDSRLWFQVCGPCCAKMGIDPTSPYRISECLAYVLQQSAENGSTIMEPSALIELAKKELDDEEGGLSIQEDRIEQEERILSLPEGRWSSKDTLFLRAITGPNEGS
jgi:exodeoxyribonuclease V alpha subunit